MRVTERDFRLVFWVNGFGYVSVWQISVWMQVDFSTAARRVRALIEAGILCRYPLPISSKGVIVPTSEGAQLAGDELAPITGIRLGTARHDSMLVDVSLDMMSRNVGTFEPERRIRHRLHHRQNDSSHVPDAFLHRPGKRPIAIELELSQKSPRRLEQIMNFYAAALDIGTVLYVVTDAAVEKSVRRFAEGIDHIQVRSWRPPAGRVSRGVSAI